MERAGGCLCGAVRFVAELRGAELGACHCDMCRRFSGSVVIAASAKAVRFEPSDALRTYRSSAWAERGFCAHCGSSLFFRLTAPGPYQGNTHVAAGALDDPSGLVLTHEMFTDRRPEGWSLAGELRGMTEAEVFAAFPMDGSQA